MFDIGFLELTVILVLALLVLGPERLPKAARSVGYWFGKARRYVEGMKSQVEAEFDTTEVKRLLRNQEVQIQELQDKLQNTDEYIDNDYHNLFDNADDPGTDTAEIEELDDTIQQTLKKEPEKKAAGPQYSIIEEADERWDELQESNPVKEPVKENADKPGQSSESLDKAQ